jgi:hypothetical protein
MIASTRSYLTVGLSAGLVLAATGAAVVTPTAGPAPITVASPAVQLSAALAPILPQIPAIDFNAFGETPGEWIINAYGVIQPWVEYGVELFAWATEWLPWPIGLLAPQSDIIYSGWQPFAESVVYSFAFLVDGQFDLIPPTLSAGIQTGITNLVQGEIAWILSFFPPLPPIGFAAAEAAAATRSAGRMALPASAASGTETGVSETGVSETGAPENGAPESAQTSTPATEATPATAAEPETAPVVAAQEQPAPAPVAVAEPEAVASPAPRATRGAARVPRMAPAASAAAVTDVAAAPSEAISANPDPEPTARKASRGADSKAGPSRAARAAR